MMGAYLLRGNGYAAIKRSGRGVVNSLIPINPDAVLVLEGFDGDIFYNVNRIGLWQIAMLREFPSSINSEDIFHIRGLSFNALVSLSTIGIARDTIGVAMGLEQQAARLMANGARPGMILECPTQLSEDAAARLGRQFSQTFAGIQNTGRTPVLEQGIKANQLQLTSVDLEFMAQRAFQLAEVSRFWRIPSHKLGTEPLRGVNLVQVDQDYVSSTIMPDLHRWEQKFDQVFQLSEQDIEIKFDETVLLRADIATRYAAARIALGGGAWASVNEVRAGEDMSPADVDATGADAIQAPVNMAAIGSDKTGTAPDGAGAPPAAEGGAGGADNVPSKASGGIGLEKKKPQDFMMALTGLISKHSEDQTMPIPEEAGSRFVENGIGLEVVVKKKGLGDQPRDEHGRWAGGGVEEQENYRSFDHISDVPPAISVTGSQEISIEYYQSSGAGKLNASLRGGTQMRADVAFHRDQLDSVLNTASLPENMTVYRGYKDGSKASKIFESLSPGDSYVDPGYSSTSMLRGVARDFAGGYSGGGDARVIKILAPTGSRAAVLPPAYMGNEAEVLTARGSKFTYIGKDKNGDHILQLGL
jgi:HK97 family phage portal protein